MNNGENVIPIVSGDEIRETGAKLRACLPLADRARYVGRGDVWSEVRIEMLLAPLLW